MLMAHESPLEPDDARALLRGERSTANIVSACLIARVSRATMYRWIAAGWVDYARTPSGRIRIFVDSLLRPPKE